MTNRYASSSTFIESIRDLLEMSGAPSSTIPDLASPMMRVDCFERMTPPDRLLDDGDDLDLPGWDLRIIWTPGHSPGHICLYSDSRRLLFSGDHILPQISPNISFLSHRISNPLGDYLASLSKIESFECDEVLPGHKWRFTGLSERIAELRNHHTTRLNEICLALSNADGLTCWQIALRLSWSRSLDSSSSFVQRAASGETLAHLALLEDEGRVRRTRGRPAMFHLRQVRGGEKK
jgi:glyoxylase-like metal-dependent hydrolase (beta-lactamase superfamily II)